MSPIAVTANCPLQVEVDGVADRIKEIETDKFRHHL